MEFLVRLIAALPLRFLHAAGGVIGTLIWLMAPSYRRRMRENLRIAGFDSGKLGAEVRRELGMQAAETAWVWGQSRENLMRHVTTAPGTDETLKRLLATGRPILFMTPHIGCFEVTPPWLEQNYLLKENRTMSILYRMPKKSILQGAVQVWRKSERILPAPADLKGVRMLLKAFRSGQFVGVLPDQVPSKGEGVWVNFFGKPAYTMTLPLKLARQFDAIRVIAWGKRIDGRGWEVGLREWEGPLSGDLEKDAAEMNRQLERLIREMPEQYLWSYNRYKGGPHAAKHKEAGK